MAYTTDKWWDENTVAVVTGSNKGIGFEIARIFAEQGITTVVTARDEELGRQAVAKIKEIAPSSRVLLHQLDISDPASVDRFVEWLRSDLGGLTILVNNAGFAYKGNIFGADEAQVTLTPYELQTLGQEFVDAIRAGNHAAAGWPNSMYGTSKLMLSLWTAQLADQLRDKGVMVNAMCPGWCRTDMSSQSGTKSAADGADTAVWLALRSPQDFKTGAFWGERNIISCHSTSRPEGYLHPPLPH
ncbi:hypothetical protein VOLCADRAFT_121544 [Volvox carteri f. nagariensis]|uniref:Uncharacterized protein n=1 Tax=Volvox carteri f. nagariensis TaxID=3068 RepID=D8UD62_VOLCA|nr:uncharacterized protein VOLCADRAFT_121544 [Volvox carteri f. nagariensis]EFJ42339.1 hypothetical protein VOLCADRAFT_121544 [Volvox carteri f. nagariensis]|eukprot:XP_002956572.1 hypothetical protein VOLCADRAFT_121544 [Volvox carteri f. nagariensis]